MNMQQHEDEINRIENTYKNIKPLSKNPTGNTYLARNVNTNELVVKKQVSLEAGEIYGKLQKLDSEHLVPVLEVCFETDKCIIVERYIPGETMEQYLERKGILADDEAKFFAMQILEGLAVIHKNGLIHRDITPSNILISQEGVVKIIDFGIARTKKVNKSKDTTILGTAGYAAPEQFGFTRCAKEDLVGGTPQENAEITLEILKGRKGPKRDAAVLNAAAGLYVAGKADTMTEGVRLAQEMIDSGKALKQLVSFVRLSNE